MGAVLCAAAVAGCMRDAPDLDAYRRHQGTAPWSVDGVRPGQSFAAVRTALGAPDRTVAVMGQDVHEWTSRRQLSVVVDGAGLVTDVTGGQVESEGKPVVWSGLGQAEIERILGRGRVQKVTQPGSGVISIGGGREVGRILTYDDKDVRFELQLEEDMLKRVRAFRPKPR